MDRRPRRPTSLATAYWNANGIKTRKEELIEFAQRHQLDVIMVNETHLRPADRISLPNYITYRDDRQNNRGGGTAIFIKYSIDHYLNTTPDLNHMEATSITVRTANGTLTLIAAYNRPNLLLLEEDLSVIFDGRNATILAGDLNSKHPTWNSRTANRNGNCLRRFADDFELTVDGPDEPTHHTPNARPDVLDIVVMKNVTMTHQLNVLSELSSDHNPVLLQIGDPTHNQDEPRHIQTISWPAFKVHIAQNLDDIQPINTTVELEAAVTCLTDRITHSIRYATNTTRIQDSRSHMPREIRELIRNKNRLRRRWQHTLNPDHRTEYNRLAQQVKDALYDLRNERWNRFLDSCEESSDTFWKTAKALRRQHNPLPPIHGPRGTALTIEEKAEAFAESLQNQCSPNYNNVDFHYITNIHRYVKEMLGENNAEDQLTPVTPEEVKATLKTFRPRKAPGNDGISYQALKNLPRKGISAMTNIYNAMLRLRHFPTQWKCADVIMIKKPNQAATRTENYRPISLLPVLGKTAEKIILQRLSDQVEELRIIPDAQFGFRREHDTTLQILRLVEHIKTGFNQSEYTGAVCLDVSKAFDKVWHQGLLYKMRQAGISIGIIQLTHSFLHKRTFRIRLPGHRSTVRTMTAGVPQGSALSPTLFNLYASDLPTTPQVSLAMYADDVCVFTKSRDARIVERRLQESLDNLEAWYRQWRIAIHPQKSTAILFSRSGKRKRRHGEPQHLNIQGEAVPWKSEIKYLGVTLDRRLTFGSHVTAVTRRARQMMAALSPMINRRSKLNPACKIKLYRTIVRPTMTYASAAWATTAKCHMNKLQVIQNRVLRMALDAPWFVRNTTIHDDTNMETIEAFIRRTATKILARAEEHPNPLIADTQKYDPATPWRYSRPRMILS